MDHKTLSLSLSLSLYKSWFQWKIPVIEIELILRQTRTNGLANYNKQTPSRPSAVNQIFLRLKDRAIQKVALSSMETSTCSWKHLNKKRSIQKNKHKYFDKNEFLVQTENTNLENLGP